MSQARVIGANVRRERKKSGLTQTQLAQLVGRGWRQQTVVKVEQGERPLKFDEGMLIAWVLGVMPFDLIRSSEDDA